jgi:hypothetical protein
LLGIGTYSLEGGTVNENNSFVGKPHGKLSLRRTRWYRKKKITKGGP